MKKAKILSHQFFEDFSEFRKCVLDYVTDNIKFEIESFADKKDHDYYIVEILHPNNKISTIFRVNNTIEFSNFARMIMNDVRALAIEVYAEENGKTSDNIIATKDDIEELDWMANEIEFSMCYFWSNGILMQSLSFEGFNGEAESLNYNDIKDFVEDENKEKKNDDTIKTVDEVLENLK